jgi:hypothetical protein
MALLTTGPLFSKQHYARYRLYRSALCKLRQQVADASQLDREGQVGLRPQFTHKNVSIVANHSRLPA